MRKDCCIEIVDSERPGFGAVLPFYYLHITTIPWSPFPCALPSLNFEDLDFSTTGLIVTLRRSKTDQEGKGYKKGIPFGKAESTMP